MKNICLISMLFSLFLSCKNETRTAIAPDQLEVRNLNETKTKETANFDNSESDLLYNHYLNIKKALVNTDYENTVKACKELHKASANFDNNTISRIALLMANSKTIEKQREFFVGLTSTTELILSNDLKSGNIYKQTCPMAFDGKGAEWLSNSKEIRNPYFGDQMLTCGTTLKLFSK